MYTYSIMPLSDKFNDYFEEICADVREQYSTGVTTCALFRMTLVPEETPVVDKVGPLCRLYRRYRSALAADGVSTGVLVQASLGHGYKLAPNPFTKYVNLTDGKAEDVCCPEDEDFLDHFSEVLRTIAAEHPDAIMLDDDFRMAVRPGRGCVCKLHMRELAKRIGREITREELYEHMKTHPDDDPITLAFLDMQRDTLIKAAKRFRDAVDSVDPTIQGINCTSGDACDSVVYTSRIWAGKGNPSIVRVPNGTYAPLTTRRFSDTMRSAVVRSSKLKNNGVDVVIAETDTVPFNRYAKNSRYLHAHYVASMLDGLKGAKHWITRFSAYEPASGKEFRNILAKHRGMYETLADLSDTLSWVGCGSLFKEITYPSYRKPEFRVTHESEWIACAIERLGIPFYYTERNCGAAFLEGDIVQSLTDDEIKKLNTGSIFLTYSAAKDLVDRGFGDMIGVEISDWNLGRISGESFGGDPRYTCSKQMETHLITKKRDDVEILSYNYDERQGEFTPLAPAVTKLKRDGGISVVFSGTPKASFNYSDAFSFLNETRKKQLVSLLKESGNLPVYYPGDAEITLRAARTADGRLLVAVWNIGFDPLETLDLCLEKAAKSISLMLPDGSLAPIDFTVSDGVTAVSTRVEPMYPVILIIE